MKPNRVLSVAAVLAVLPLASAHSDMNPAKLKPKAIVNVLLGPSRPLPCEGTPPFHNTVTITNSFSSPIPAGTRVEFWYAKEEVKPGTSGMERTFPLVQVTLGSNLGPGQELEFEAPWMAQHDRNCGAWFYAGRADLELLQFSASQGVGLLKIRNNNRFVDAPQSVVRIKAMKCSQIQLASVNRAFPAIGPGATQELSVPVPAPAGCQYYDVHVDPNNAIREPNENNNTSTGVGVCIQ